VGDALHAEFGHGDLFVLAWFVASAATVGGGLGSGLETDEAICAAAYSKREQDRRDRLERDHDQRAADDDHGDAAATTINAPLVLGARSHHFVQVLHQHWPGSMRDTLLRTTCYERRVRGLASS
jgi:hypothetical protein